MMKWQENKAKSAKMFEEARKYLEDRDRMDEEMKDISQPAKNRRGHQGIIDDGLVVLSDELNEDSEGDANNERL